MKPQRFDWSVIDTETSDKFDFKAPADAAHQPRLCELAIVRINQDLEIVSEYCALIRPDGWTVNEDGEAFGVHSLSNEKLLAEGHPVAHVLDVYEADILAGRAVASFHAQFDTKIMRAEFRRLGRSDHFEKTPNTCLMRSSMALKVKKANGKGGFPALADVYRHFFGIEPEGKAHGALTDARNAARILIHMVQLGILPAPQIHYAKSKEGAPF